MADSGWKDGYAPAEAARLLGLTPNRVRQLTDDGTLECRRTPLGRLIDGASLRRLIERRKNNPTRNERGRSQS